jgi:23S rRNA (uracil1939-C5)-methyltransferase
LSADSQNCAARLTVEEELTPPAVRHLIQAVVRQTQLDGVWIADDRGALEAGEVRLRGLISTGFGKRYRLRGGGFHQASPEVNEALVRAVVDAARPQRRQRIVDMHGGAGNFGLVLAAKGADVTISEIDPWACEDLALNVQAFKGRGQVRAAEMTGSQALLRCSRRGAVHCVVFDAPRTGDAQGAATVAKVGPHRVVALGCDPATFCRDLRTMGLGTEYRLTELGLWDAFPETHHFESMAVLERQT